MRVTPYLGTSHTSFVLKMIGKIFKKILGRSRDKENKKSEESKISTSLHDKASKVQKFLEERFEFAHEEFYVIKKKLEDLRETNYNQGLKYLERGDVRDAIFRFRIVKKFWPDLLDAHYYLAYALMLNKKPLKAKVILQELLQHHPDYDHKAQELLNKIENISSNAA